MSSLGQFIKNNDLKNNGKILSKLKDAFNKAYISRIINGIQKPSDKFQSALLDILKTKDTSNETASLFEGTMKMCISQDERQRFIYVELFEFVFHYINNFNNIIYNSKGKASKELLEKSKNSFKEIIMVFSNNKYKNVSITDKDIDKIRDIFSNKSLEGKSELINDYLIVDKYSSASDFGVDLVIRDAEFKNESLRKIKKVIDEEYNKFSRKYIK